MLTIRASQLALLEQARVASFSDDMQAHVLRHFSNSLPDIDGITLQLAIDQTLLRAREYGLENRASRCRFLNLALIYGWQFDTDPQNAWMREMLRDTEVSSADDRIRLLVDECLYRLRIEEQNRRLRSNFAVSA